MPATSPTRLLYTLARAAGKAATAKLRGVGVTAESPDWPARAMVCERCSLKVVLGNVSYCGQPLLRQLVRDDAVHGCGCPTRAKAKDPTEHCPITPHHEPSADSRHHGPCACKWCDAKRPRILPAAA